MKGLLEYFCDIDYITTYFKAVCPEETKYEISVEYQDACLIVSTHLKGDQDNT